jgi:pilus assembly protein CpaF
MVGTWPQPADGAPAAPAAPVAPGDRAAERALREEVRQAVGALLDERRLLAPRPEDEQRIRSEIRARIAAHQRRAAAVNEPQIEDSEGLERRLFDAILRLGVIQPLMDDPAVEEVIVNSPTRVFAIRHGRKRWLPDVAFEDDDEVRALVKRLVGTLGRRLDDASPMVDARLPDGSRLNAAIPPATTRHCAVTIRKFLLRAHSLEDLVRLGTLPEAAAHFLDACVQAGVNIVVSGPTGSGKTTLLNALGAAVASENERVVTIEETVELTLERQLPDCVALQARAGNVEGAGEIRIRDLVKNALRMRPTRIVIGEVRGAEALDMLLAMNTGHEGSLSTLHANAPRDALDRLAMLASMAEERLPADSLAKLVARTVELVVQLRFEPATGRRRVAEIFEVTGLEGDVVTGGALWTLDPATDRLEPTAMRPRCLAKIAGKGVAYAPPADAGLGLNGHSARGH